LKLVEGTVAKILFSATDGGFAVVRLEVAGHDGPVTAVGPLAGLAPGESVRIEGEWERHPSHGDQLRAERAVAVLPKSEVGVARYLTGLSGIGPTLAKRLVSAFGVGALDVIADEAWRAAQIPGMGKKRAMQASEDARARRSEREVMVLLQGQGVSAAWATRIRKVWGDLALSKLRQNPYLLAREIPGIGFQTADQIARGMGIDPGSPLRIEAALYHALETFSDEGSLYAPRALLLERATGMIEMSGQPLELALAALIAQGAVIREEDGVWLPRLHQAESALARRIIELLSAPRRALPAPKARGKAALAPLSVEQQRAVGGVRDSAVCVITGGPGTGKTTVVKAIVAAWEEAQRRVVLCAPTGRAAKRLSEATGKGAQTVHRLLEYGRAAGGKKGPIGANRWGRDEKRPLEADLVVVDESSMLDVQLARALCAAVPLGATLVFVGDVDQLPSVGPGRVLADLIDSQRVPVARLTEIFRQGEGSRIIRNARAVLAGDYPESAPEGERRADFYLVSVDDPVRAREMIVRLCRERIPQAFALHPSREVQVLTPMHRGEAGTTALNRALQEALNPGGIALERGNRAPLRVGDKVMQSRNDYDRDVFNGDVGEVAAVDPEGPSAQVIFDERRVDYDGEALGDLELAYAVSIHKSQGSEYPAVVIALLPQHFVLLRRNLLYTAITRGKRLVVLVGAPRAIRRAVENAGDDRRYTRLRERLQNLTKG
jgi:exodeoxyribonuclease V alpha subunit